MEFKNADDAAYAMAAMNGHPFDAKHTFWVNRFNDVEKFASMDETWVEPEPESYKPKVRLSVAVLNNTIQREVIVGTSPCLARGSPRA